MTNMNPQTHKEISEICEQATIRVAKIFHLGAALAEGPDALPSDLEDAISDDIDEESAELLADVLPWLQEALNDKDRFCEAAFDANTLGFLILAEQPVIDPKRVHKDGKGYGYSWGCYRQRWFYGETFADAVSSAQAWAGSNIHNAQSAAGVAGLVHANEA